MKYKTALIFIILLLTALSGPGFAQETMTAKTLAPGSGQLSKMSLDIKGMDIIDALKLLSKQAGLNIVAGKNIRGKITLFLKNVDPWDAFEIILAANSLAYEERNGIITVMTERDYELIYGEKFNVRKKVKTIRLRYAKAAEVSKVLNQIKSKIGIVIVDENSNSVIIKDTPAAAEEMAAAVKELDILTKTKVYALNYAAAEKIKEKLTNVVSKLGIIEMDERTNKLMVTDIPEKIKEIDNLIAEFDERTRQVLIEAKIIQIDLNDDYKFGINWDKFFGELGIGTALADFSGVTAPGIPTSGGGSGGIFTLGNFGKDEYQATVKALETLGRTNILSSPRVMTVNNEEAKILVGTNQPYATSTTSTAGDTQTTSYQITYLDLGIKLHVTPTINADGFITMKIKPEVSSQGTPYTYGEFNDEVPVVTTSEAETTVMVKDGTTIVIAGLMESRDQEDVDKVPILGDIPIIGALFRNKSKGSTSDSEKTELVIFITPRIITGDVTSEEITDYDDVLHYLETWDEDMEFFKGKDRQIDPVTMRGEESFFGYEEAGQVKPTAEEISAIKEEAVAKRIGGLTFYKDAVPKEAKTTELPRDYKELVRSKVHRLIKQRLNPAIRGEVYIEFSVSRDGKIKKEPEILNSTDESLKRLVIRCIKDASPFPSFPPEVTVNTKSFKIFISYQ